MSDNALLYAKSFSLLLEEVQSSSDTTMVRSGLLRVRRFSRSHGLTVEMVNGQLTVDSITLLRPLPALQRLATAMQLHRVSRITLSAGAIPRELLELAILLTRKRQADGDTPSIFEELRNASLWSVRCFPAARTNTPLTAESHEADVALDSTQKISVRGEEMARAAASALRDGHVPRLASTLGSIVALERAVTAKELRAAWSMVFTGAATPKAIRALVNALPTCGEAYGACLAAIARSGDVAAEILIDELLASESKDVRRECFDALIETRRGTPKLLTLLEHEQWFVVRNAACLLGAFQSKSSEPELTTALAHPDERVRAAVVSALLALDTESTRATVRGAIRDSSAEVRRRAVRGFLAEAGTSTHAEKLLSALDRETELDVQLEFLYALGTLATPNAVQKLIRICQSDGRRRPADFRIAAAEALASARLSAAVPLLREMLKDPDQHARAAARHLIRAVS
jgi:hypothetical protein